MKGDFTRDTFDPAQHFSRVLMQQGRVQLDADWNEQASILLHYVRTLAADILGPYAGPGEAMGFGIVMKNTARLEAVLERMEPDEARRKYLADVLNGTENNVVLGIGRYYVQGVLVENHRPILYTEQAGYPFSPDMELGKFQDKEFLFYLDVWERHITYVENDHIREVALGGADTCTRAQVVWQVKVLLRDNQGSFGCDSVESLLARRNLPTLRARARRAGPSAELCSVSPESQYRGLENHLYRVEVHAVETKAEAASKGKKVQMAAATFKWSRDNASVVFPIVSLSGTTVVVDTLGRDPCSLLKPGDWVEVCDDELALREQSGVLAQVETVDRDELKLTLKWPNSVTELPAYDEATTPNLHPLLRRWDHAGDLAAYHGALPVTESTLSGEGWIDLEDGVQVWFGEGGEYRVGDYWLIPARVATGDVEWPAKLDNAGMPMLDDPAEQPPHGPIHYYAPLHHLAKNQAGNQATTDCRCTLRPTAICAWKEK